VVEHAATLGEALTCDRGGIDLLHGHDCIPLVRPNRPVRSRARERRRLRSPPASVDPRVL
jgi:hypothetical protein